MKDEALELFVILGWDGPRGKELRPSVRPEHLAHLARQGARVALAGPMTDGAGSLILLRAESLEAARAIAEADPYLRAGVFARVEVHPFKQAIP